MIILFNILVLGAIALIAYMLATEGLFSSILHTVCVIVAGCLALALWEPLAHALFNGGTFDNYIWGVSLLGLFAVSLLVLRLASDKIAPANLNFPEWANYTFGALFGLCSGVLTVGICLIGVGFMQSSSELLGYQGYGRDAASRGTIEEVGDPIWVNAPKLTSDFFSFISVGAFRPDFTGEPLMHNYPDIHVMSTLVRDSFEGGKGQLAMKPGTATVSTIANSEDGLFVIQVAFHPHAKDFGGQLILSNSQVRLIGDAEGTDKPDVYHPVAWQQEIKDGGEQLFRFDDISHYATSVPGRQETQLKFIFDTKNRNFEPKFVQIKGTRINIPTLESTPINPIAAKVYRGKELSDEEILAARDPLGKNIQHLVEVTSRIRNLRISTNGIPGSIEVDEDNNLVEGELTTVWTQQGVSHALAVKGIRPNPGTAIVHVNVSKGTNASFSDLLSVISDDASISLIDTVGHKYAPIGYYIDDGKRMILTLTPSSPFRAVTDLPTHILSSSGDKKLYLVFQVTEGQWIKELRVGDHTVGTCNHQAEQRNR